MAINVKDKKKKCRRRFGQASGKNSKTYKETLKDNILKKEEKMKVYSNDPRTFKPYQLVRKVVSKNGKYFSRFTVRRLNVARMNGTKLCRLDSTSLKFVIHKQPLSGYRLINLDMLKDHVVNLTTHACLCPKAQDLAREGKEPIVVRTEICQSGLFSILLAKCNGCLKEFQIETSQKTDKWVL